MARRYARDNRGRFAPKGSGATARGGRLRTAAGNKRKTQTMQASAAPKGTIGKPRGLKPQDSSKLKKGIAYNRMRAINAKIANRPDIAQQHIPGRFRGQAAKRMDASIDRAVKQVKAAEMARFIKPKAQVKAERAARAEAKRQAAAAKPKRVRSAESLRISRAKRVLKEREMKTSGTLKQWEQSKRTQERALAFYKSKRAAAAKPARAAATGRGGKVKGAARVAKPAATAKPASKLGFTQSDFARRSQRTASIRNPQVKAKAQQLYGRILDLNSTPRQLKSMFKKAGKPKQRTATAATRQRRREHQNMMAASKLLFK